MALPPQYDYKIGYGWNLPDGSLTNVEALTDNQGRRLYPPSAYSSWNPGTSRLRTDGNIYQTGFTGVEWEFDTFWREWYQVWQSTFTVGGTSYGGNVTIKTPSPAGTFTAYSGVMILPPLSELERNLTSYKKVKISFMRLSVVP